MGEWNGMEIWVVLSVHKTYQRLWNSTKCFNQIIFLFSSNLIHKLLSFWIFLSFSFSIFLFLRNFIPSFCFWFSFFLSLNNNNKNKQLLQTFSFSTIINSQAFKDKKSLSKSCKHNGDGIFEVVEWMCVKWVNKGKLMMYMAQVGYS